MLSSKQDRNDVPARWATFLDNFGLDYTENGRLAEGLQRWTYQEATLADGMYQVASYQPGEGAALSEQMVTAVPAGNYHVQVGIYRPETGNRLPTTPAFPDDSVRLTTITQ